MNSFCPISQTLYEDGIHSREKKIIRDAIFSKCKGKLDASSFKRYLRCAFYQDTYRYDIVSDEEMARVVSWVCNVGDLLNDILGQFKWKKVERGRAAFWSS